MAGMSYPINLGLGDVPDPELPPEVWQELNKLSLACKHIASSLGISTSSGSNSEFLVGTPAEGVSIQDYSKIRIVPSFAVAAGEILEIEGIAIYKTSSAHPYPVAFAETALAAGVSGTVVLLGMVHYVPGGLVPGSKYFVDLAVPGAITTNPAGRYVGQAFAPAVLFFDPLRA